MGDSEAVSNDGGSGDGAWQVPEGKESGVVRTEIDALHHALTIDFDPKLISEEGVRRVAERLAPIGHQQYCRTILRLDGRASGAAEQRIDGIRRARATFLGGVMTVAFDDARLSEAQVVERVRETGAPVKPYVAEPERAPETVGQWLRYWTTSERLEAVFTALTLVFMTAGWVTGKLGMPWQDAFYLGAYLPADISASKPVCSRCGNGRSMWTS